MYFWVFMSFKIKNRPSVFKIKNRPLARLVGMLIRQKQHTHNAPGPPSESLTSECILLRTVYALSMSRLTPFFFLFLYKGPKDVRDNDDVTVTQQGT